MNYSVEDKTADDKLTNLQSSAHKIEQILEVAFNGFTDDLSIVDKLNHDLFVAYGLNTLFWMYLRVKGINPNNHEIKKELTRIKEFMVNAKNAIERHTLRKKLDVSVAERFIKHGINHSDKTKEASDKCDEPNPKKRKLN